jgi:hypothetical protein
MHHCRQTAKSRKNHAVLCNHQRICGGIAICVRHMVMHRNRLLIE